MKRSALLGGMIWAGLGVGSAFGRGPHWIVPQLGTIELLFLLGPLVVVPLGLELFAQLDNGTETPALVRMASWIQFPAALLVIASFFLEPGFAAAALALPWFFVGSFLACQGLLILTSPGPEGIKEACSIASFLYLPIGCAWLIASRFGLGPMGFQEPIVLLTAVHFHFAGFAAPPMMHAAVDALERSSLAVRKMSSVVATGVLIGPAMLAAGFVVGPRFKLTAALLIVVSEAGLAVLFLFASRQMQPGWARILVGVSGAFLVGAMALAGVWAIGEFPMQPFVHLAEMARFHGTANALGFTVCGLLGWIFSESKALRWKRGGR